MDGSVEKVESEGNKHCCYGTCNSDTRYRQREEILNPRFFVVQCIYIYMLYFKFILRIYLVCSRQCIIISIDGTSYKVEEHCRSRKMYIEVFILIGKKPTWKRLLVNKN